MQFDFGENWLKYSEKALNADLLAQAKNDFLSLTQGIDLSGKSFLDLGFGQGLSLLGAASFGAKVVGCDINPQCESVLRKNLEQYFPELKSLQFPIIIGSLLEENVLKKIQESSPDLTGTYDIVHSWGVLHHNGDMYAAIKKAAGLVKANSWLIISIYNRHWTSPIWKQIKYLYCISPAILKKGIIALMYPIIYLAKLLVTGENPKRSERGMDFFNNVIDWVGGYPYEYASPEEIKALLKNMGFSCLKVKAPQVPTGCNEFVFRKE